MRTAAFVLATAIWLSALAQESLTYTVTGESLSRAWLSVLYSAPEDNPSATQSPELELRQRFRYTLTLSRLDSATFEARWTNWEVETPLTPELKQLLAEIQRLSPAYYRRATAGTIELFSPAGREAWQRQAVASILYPFQFVRPSGTNQAEWRTEEQHPSGRVRCRYRLVRTEKNGVQVVNKVVEAVVLSEEEQRLGKTHTIKGHLEYRLDAAGTILSVRGTTREQIGYRGLPASYTEQRLDIQFVRRTALSSAQLKTKRAQLARLQGSWHGLYAPPTQEEQQQARAAATLRGKTRQQLLEATDQFLARVDAGENIPVEQQNQLRVELEAGFVVYGEPLARALAQRLQTRSQDDDGFWLLAGVLSYSGLREAQAALAEFLIQTENTRLKRALAQQIALMRAPHSEVVQQLWDYARTLPAGELQQVLIVSLSNLVRQLRTRDEALYNTYSDWSRTQLEAAQEPTQQRFWLTVVGALANPTMLPLIEQYARRGDEATRLSALSALSNLGTAESVAIAVRLYPLEPSPAVREKIAQLLGKWWHEPQARTTLEQAVFTDTSVRVRKAVVQVLGELATKHNDALELLVRVAETNSEPAIRREAMIALAALHAAGVQVPPVKAAPAPPAP